MKHLFAVLSVSLVLIGVLTLNAQQYGIEWADTLNTGDTDFAFDVAIDVGGNVYVTGAIYNGPGYDYLTVKYDASGNVVWADTLNESSSDEAEGIAIDGSGNIYVTGHLDNGSNYDYLTVEYDSSGNIVWADTIDNGDDDYARSIAVDRNGNVYVTGESYISGSFDYFTVKYDANKNILWTRALDNGRDDARSIAVDTSGNVYVTGKSYNGSNDDCITVKYDAWGDTFWVDTLDNGSDDHGSGITVDKNSNVYVTGASNIGSNEDYLTVKYDASGNILRVDTLLNGGGKGITLDTIGNVYVIGGFWNGSNVDYLTVKYDSLGNIVWADTIDNGSDDYGNGIAIDVSGNIYVTGYSNYNYFTVKYGKYKDLGAISIVSPDTVGTDSSYTPQIWVGNYSYQDTLSFDIDAYIEDSSGTNLYADTQSVSNLTVGDSVLVSFASWTAPSTQGNYLLGFSILTSDMNADNDTTSKTLSVKDMSGILNKDINRTTMLNVATINKGRISFSYNIAKSKDYNIALYSIDGRLMKKIEGVESGYHSGKFSNLPSGIYFLRLKQGDEVINKKVVVIK